MRSTKAGGGTPATLAVERRDREAAVRSTKAGGGTPATPHAETPNSVSSYRSTKAGGGTPATPPPPASPLRSGIRAQRRPEVELRQHVPCGTRTRKWFDALNEGRRWNSGNTRHLVRIHDPAPDRSTKAGGGTPATRGQGFVHRPLAVSAQRRPEVELRQHGRAGGSRLDPVDRSTKAGGGTPATRRPARSGRRGWFPLNEGRRWNSGNTVSWFPLSAFLRVAQRRPEVELRQHGLPESGKQRPIALNEGRRWNSGNTPKPRSNQVSAESSLNEGRRWNSGNTSARW